MNRAIPATRITPRTVRQIKADIMRDVYALQDTIETDSKLAEDRRANARNRNRAYMLAGTLIMMFTLVSTLKALAPSLVAYSAPLALVPDILLAAYAYWRKF
jgi:hypothetical protein